MDDQSSTEHARAATERMILKDKIHVLVAGMTSASALVIAPLAVRAQIPMLTPSATHPAVTEFGELIFRTCFIDETQAQIMARHAVKKQGYSRVAILKDVQSSYSMQLAESFARSAQELGATLVGTEIYSSGDDDFEIPLTALKALKPEAIYIPGYHRDIGRILATALELGVDAVFLGADGWAAPSLWLDRKSTVPVSFFTSHFHVDEPLAKVQDFVAAYKMRFNEAPDAFAALGYDVAQIVIKAIKAVPRANAQALGAQLLRAAPHRGVTGTIDLRDATQKSAVIVEVDAGGLRFHERASLSTE